VPRFTLSVINLGSRLRYAKLLLKYYSLILHPKGTGSTNIAKSDKFHWRAAFDLQSCILEVDKKTSTSKIQLIWGFTCNTELQLKFLLKTLFFTKKYLLLNVAMI